MSHRLTFSVSRSQAARGATAACLDCGTAVADAAHWLASSCCAAGLLRWDTDYLTLDGEPWLKVHVTTPLALASAILRMTCAELEPKEEEAKRFAVEVISPLFPRPFTMTQTTPMEWLAAARKEGNAR